MDDDKSMITLETAKLTMTMVILDAWHGLDKRVCPKIDRDNLFLITKELMKDLNP